jgi:hypothetical protein
MAKSTKPAPPVDLAAILRRLNPNVPAGTSEEGLQRFPRDSAALRQLRTHIAADPHAKVLLSGHIGVGKSTELFHLARQFANERLVVRCEIGEKLGVHNVTTFSLLIAILEASMNSLWEIWGKVSLGLVEEIRGQVSRFLPGLLNGNRKPNSAQEAVLWKVFAPSASFETGSALTLKLRNADDIRRLFTDALQRLALGAISLEESVSIDPSPVFDICRVALLHFANAGAAPVLLVIDDLDKMRNELAREDVFLARARVWQMLPCGIMATMPLDAVLSEIGPELDQAWHNRPFVLEPLAVPKGCPLRGTLERIAPARRPYPGILQSVGAGDVISWQQCWTLARASGGILRNFVSACASCVRYAIEASESRVKDFQVDLVLQDLTNLWRGRLNDSDYQALVDVVDSRGSNVPRALHLLRDGLIIRDADAPADQQFRLAPWVEPLVETYRERMAEKTANRSK